MTGTPCSSSSGSRARKRVKPEVLVFEGGGTKGIHYAGAIRHLEAAGFLDDVHAYAGTSAGAQQAALCAFGYTGEECENLVRNTSQLRNILDGSGSPCACCGCGCCGCGVGFCTGLFRLKRHHGFYLGDFLEDYLDGLFAEKRVSGERGCTFEQLYEEKHVELRVGVCNVVSRKFEYLDRHSNPTLQVSRAVRASSAIPLVFLPQHIGDGLYVDGMFQGNLPVAAFIGRKVLAFHLSPPKADRHETSKTLSGFMTSILDMLLNSAQRKYGVNFDTYNRKQDDPSSRQRTEQDLVDILTIDCGDHGVMETKLTVKDVEGMLASGRSAAESYLQEFDECGDVWDQPPSPRRRCDSSVLSEPVQVNCDTASIERALLTLESALPTAESTNGGSRDIALAALHALRAVVFQRGGSCFQAV
eukprot:TRINITY_DN5187_c0_g2_i1.p1 TRINITY_DN5187_c0_g2~~TRINITY_DN5187_c0_g2_i1.p1  ORF type:complete len:463 (-),score=48.48 TRINITY_DN5187_c0_g2_i1:80-1327(-)